MGQYYDWKTGPHYNWHRYYDQVTGRYITADPIGLDGGINLYAYAGNDPVNSVDPWGLVSEVDYMGVYGDSEVANIIDNYFYPFGKSQNSFFY